MNHSTTGICYDELREVIGYSAHIFYRDGTGPTSIADLDRIYICVSRGFVSAIHTSFAVWRKFGSNLVQNFPIEEVRIVGKSPIAVSPLNEFGWNFRSQGLQQESYNVPRDVYESLTGVWVNGFRCSVSKQDAYENLSSTLIRMAKQGTLNKGE
jgi:hypothetical protein